MIPPRPVLLALAASVAACGGPTVIPGPATTPDGTPAPTSPPPAASANASPLPAKPTPCSTSAPCTKNEVCCVTDDLPAIEFCAAWAKPTSEADIEARAAAACAAAAPPAVSKGGPHYTALECIDSSDCGADELCVLGARAPAESVASCVKKKAAAGSKEICGRGRCKAARTACQKSEIQQLSTCEPTTTWRCGATSCHFPEVCCAGRVDSHCQSYACSKMEGPAWACSEQAHCGEGQVCCLVNLGHMGSRCAFGCTGEVLAPTCTKDADCPDVMGKKSKCSVVQDALVAGVKACQVP